MKSKTLSSTSKSRYRSPNGQSRMYKDGDRYKLRTKVGLHDGSEIYVTGSGKTQYACQKNTEKLVEKRKAEYKANTSNNLTVARYCTHWLENVRPLQHMAYRTKTGYEIAIRLHIAPRIGDIQLEELTREDIQNLYAAILKDGKSRSVQKDVRAVLNGALDEAVYSGIISSNPSRTVRIASKEKKEIKFLTPEEVSRVLEVAQTRKEGARWGLALIMAIRQGERLALRWQDIDIDSPKPMLYVRHTLVRMTGKGLVLTEPKSSSSKRALQIPPGLAQEIRLHKTEQKKARLQAGSSWEETDFVLTTPRGTPIDPANDRKDWKALLQASGVDEMKQHGARSTAATLMYANGVDIYSVSKVLGHSNISTTADYYTHVGDELKLKAVSCLDNLLNAKNSNQSY